MWYKLSQSKRLHVLPIPTTDVSVFGQNSHAMKNSPSSFSQNEQSQQIYTQLISLLAFRLIEYTRCLGIFFKQ